MRSDQIDGASLPAGLFELVHDLRDPSSGQSLTSGNGGSSCDLAGVELPLPFDRPLQSFYSSRLGIVT
jgi:hypothetical protein